MLCSDPYPASLPSIPPVLPLAAQTMFPTRRYKRCLCRSDPPPAYACAIRGRSAPRPLASDSLMSEISKILTPRKRSFCADRQPLASFLQPAAVAGGSGGNPWSPQSSRPFGISTDMNSKFLYTDTSPCPPGHTSASTKRHVRRIGDVVDAHAVEISLKKVVALETRNPNSRTPAARSPAAWVSGSSIARRCQRPAAPASSRPSDRPVDRCPAEMRPASSGTANA